MNTDSLKKGKCPHCGGNDIFTDKELPRRGERCTIPISSFKSIFTEYYVCLSCGFFEEFISDKVLQNAEIISKIKETWKKV